MKTKQLVIGLAPTRRDTNDFDLRFAHERKASVEKRIREIADKLHVEVVNVDFLNEEGLLIYPEEAERAAEYFKCKNVDAVITPHVNFGAEESVAILGKRLGKPLLLWGPRDETPPSKGPRQTDSQCGLFATGMILDRYNVPYTYLENCWLDSEIFQKGLEHFFRVASVVKAFRTMRIGQVSVRPRTFLSVKVNENELLEKFGIGIVTIDFTEMKAEIQKTLDNWDERAEQLLENLKRSYETSSMDAEAVRRIAAMECAFLKLSERYGCNCFASECWRTFSVPYGIMPCAGFADLIQRNLPVACECDIHGAISSSLLAAADFWNQPTFLADMTIRHPTNDNAELLWHCGPCPTKMAKPGVQPRMECCLGQFELARGQLTVCRFGGSHGQYKLFTGQGRAVEGPPTNGNYLWLETNNWPEWEKRLVKGPYIHHMSAMYGDYADVLEDACEYMSIEPDVAP
jgi:L-fucose isomerase-like protein